MKTLLCMLFCPRYFADMPQDQPGKWVAVAISESHFRAPREVETQTVNGLQRAYRKARWLALKADWRIPDCNGEVGIRWAIRKA